MSTSPDRHVIGLISDTHGMVRAGVHQALSGVEMDSYVQQQVRQMRALAGSLHLRVR